MTDAPLDDWNPATVLLAGIDPSRTALEVPDGATWTYGDLDREAAALAGALQASGAGVGDRVVVQVDKSLEAVALYLACLRIGAVFVPLNTAYTPAEVAFFVDDAAPTVLVARPDAPLPPSAHRPEVRTLGPDGDGTLVGLASVVEPVGSAVRRGADDWAAMLYTSGTTGRSKGSMLSCRNLVANARALIDAWRFEADDVLIHVLPIFHVHGLFVALHCALGVGARVRFHLRFDADAVVADLPGSTVLMGVPTHHHRLLAHPGLDRDRCAGMRLFTSGSAPLPADEHDAFAARTGHRIVERYGMTETMILTSNPYDPHPAGTARIAGTVGFPLDGVELRVRADDGEPAAMDEPGAVEVRGPGVHLGYWHLPERTAEAVTDDGWFRTGDVGSLDAEGRLTLAGRAGDMIITGGLNVYPKEIEQVLDRAPGVEESAVVGVPDPDFGEAVVAVIVAEADAEVDEVALRAACDAHLARFKHPKRYVVVDELPRNAMGKVTKADLRRTLSHP